MCDRFMKLSLSKSYPLEEEYTNHSIRATVISSLDNAGFKARHIIKLSSHKSEATVKEYATKCPEKKRKEMFQSLSNKIQPKPKKAKTATVTSSNPPEPNENAIAPVNTEMLNMNFDLQPIDDFDTIDDEALAKLVYNLPTDNNNAKTQPTGAMSQFGQQQDLNLPVQPQINTQVITQNVQNQYLPRIPPMYFPHSNVTINYNFGK